MKFSVILFTLLSAIVAGVAGAAEPPGRIDPTFGVNGKRIIGFDVGGNLIDDAYAMAKAPDGRIYLAGPVAVGPLKVAIGLTRLLPDGAIDVGFKNGGRVNYLDPGLSDVVVYDAAVQADGKVLVTGAGKRIGDPDAGVITCRFESNGDIDVSFGDPGDMPGCSFLDIGTAAASRSVVVLSSGEIMMAGYATVSGLSRALLIKLDSNGVLKNTFGTGGIRNVTAGWVHGAEFVDLAMTQTGMVVAVGTVNLNGVNQDWIIGRFSQSSGGSDSNFVGGIKILGFNAGGTNSDVATAAHVRSDQSILVAGYVTTETGGIQPAVAKYLEDGQLATFGDDGKRIYDPCEAFAGCDLRPYDLTTQADGKIVLAGAANSMGNATKSDLFALRLTPNGSRDVNFGTPGGNAFGYYDAFGQNDIATRIMLQGNRLLLAGYATVAGNNRDFVAMRLDHGIQATHTVTPVSGANGSISPNTPQIVADSGHVNFTITPAPGFVATVEGCGGQLVGNNYITAPVTDDCTVNATFNSNVTLKYTAGANGTVNGGTTVEVSVPYGSNGPLVTATPEAEHYYFSTWSDGVNDNPRQDLNVTASLDVMALFQINSYKVYSEFNTGGTVDHEGSIAVEHGQSVQLTVMPDLGFGVAGVEGCQGLLIGNTYVTGPVIEQCTVLTTFEPSDAIYTLSYSGETSCSVQGDLDQQVESGDSGSQVTAVPEAGHFFVQWSDGSTSAQRTDTHVFNDIKVSATCAPDGSAVHIVSPAPGLGGALSPPIPQSVADGDAVQFVVLPLPGFGVESVSGCPNGTLVGNTYLTGPVTADCTVEAVFTASQTMYDLKYFATLGGSLTGPAVQSVMAGGDGETVSAIADPGHFFVQWSDGSLDQDRTDTHVVGNIDVTAQFAPTGTLVHTVTPIASVGGALSPFNPVLIAEGAKAEFTVLPNEGFAIEKVEGCGGVLVGNVFTTDFIKEDCTVEATFIESDAIFTLTYAAGPNGLIVGEANQVVAAGGTGSEVVAFPINGAFFVQWTDGWAEAARTDANVIGDVDVVATFALNGTPLFTVTPLAGPGGSFIPADPQIIAQNGVAQFTVVPIDGFAIEYVKGCDGTLGPGGVFTTAPIVADCQVEAGFVTDRIFANDFEIIEP
jgi:uncharacterized delta-60 repeat protein